MHDLSIEPLLLILTTGLLAGYACRQISLPPLIGYLALGAGLGEGALGWIASDLEEIEHLAELGVFFLLFSIGLELSLDELKRMRWHLTIGGGTQMLVVAIPTAITLNTFGWNLTASILVASALSFSSTVLVFKTLGEQGQTSTSVGRRTLSILLFQDAALVPILLCLPILAGSEGSASIVDWLKTAVATVAFLVTTVGLRVLMNKVVIPRIARHRSPDLVVLMTLTTLGGITLFAYRIGLPPALGAFAAGLAFGGNRWSEQVDSLILPFREAFAAIFFVSLGLLIDFREVIHQPVAIFVGVAAVIAIKSLAAFAALWATGLDVKKCARPSVGLAHVGEFAFVVILLGATSGVLTAEEQKLLATISGVTLFVAPFLIRWGFECTAAFAIDQDETDDTSPVDTGDLERRCVVIGMGPVGRSIVGRLETLGYSVHAVDSNPLNLQSFAQLGFATVAGDGQKAEVLLSAGTAKAQIVMVCVAIDEVALSITSEVRRLNPTTRIVVRCRYANQVAPIREAGADIVISEEARSTQDLIEIVETLGSGIGSEAQITTTM